MQKETPEGEHSAETESVLGVTACLPFAVSVTKPKAEIPSMGSTLPWSFCSRQSSVCDLVQTQQGGALGNLSTLPTFLLVPRYPWEVVQAE